MNHSHLLALTALASSIAISAGAPAASIGLNWFDTFATEGGATAHSTVVDRNGFVYTAATEVVPGSGFDFLVVKYDPLGGVIWSRRYDDVERNSQIARRVLVDGSGNVTVIGDVQTPTDQDILVVSYAPDGTERWARRFSGPNGGRDVFADAALDQDGAIFFAATVQEATPNQTDFGVGKIASNGDLLWLRTNDGESQDKAVALAEFARNVYVAGDSMVRSTNQMLAVTLKYGPNGQLNWRRPETGRSFDGRDPRVVDIVVAPNDGTVCTIATVVSNFDNTLDIGYWGYTGGGGFASAERRGTGVSGGFCNDIPVAGAWRGDDYLMVVANQELRQESLGVTLSTFPLFPVGGVSAVATYSGPVRDHKAVGVVCDGSLDTFVVANFRYADTGTDIVVVRAGSDTFMTERQRIRWAGPNSFNDSARAVAINPIGTIAVAGASQLDAVDAPVTLLLEPTRVFSGPFRFRIERGRLVSGGLNDLLRSDDRRLNVQALTPLSIGTPSVEVVVDGTAPVGPVTALQFRVESRVTATPAQNVIATIEVFNFAQSQWVRLSEEPATNGDVMRQVTLEGNLSQFIEPSTRRLQARVQWFDRGVAGLSWQAQVDQLGWVVTE
jgi:hypothetical protein